jgi:hypothetical protein
MTVHPLATDTRYRNSDGTGAETTSYSRDTWYADGSSHDYNSVKILKTRLPEIDQSQNGPSTTSTHVYDESYVLYDSYGNPVWLKDADGHLTYQQYDVPSASISKLVQDVDTGTAHTSDYSDYGTAPWSSSGTPLRLITTWDSVVIRVRTKESPTYSFPVGPFSGVGQTGIGAIGSNDSGAFLGNAGDLPPTIHSGSGGFAYQVVSGTVKTTDPNGNVTYTKIDAAHHEVRVYPGFVASDSTHGTTTGPIQVYREYRPAGNASSGQRTVYTETLTSSATPPCNISSARRLGDNR